ncbi:MAG: hypothetical protein ACREBE_20550 [bacterium]
MTRRLLTEARRLASLHVALIALVTINSCFLGCRSMSGNKLDLQWEWPAGRQAESRLLVQVDSIAKASKGVLEIGRSPSMANNLPDATDVTGTVTAGPEGFVNRTVRLRLPGVEAAKLVGGAPAGFGLVGESTVVCVAPAPSRDPATNNKWLTDWSCSG